MRPMHLSRHDCQGLVAPPSAARIAPLPEKPISPAACACPDAFVFPMSFCAIDFGTSNSALALFKGETLSLAELEPGFSTMPTAVFYCADEAARHYGRAAVAAYVDGQDGRLMRSLKSILGSDLMEETTEIGHGRSVRYLDVVLGYLRRMRDVAQAQSGITLRRAVLGRPVFFVDDD